MTGTTPQSTVGVLGATGQQGGAVVDALLATGAPVRAIVRDPGSAKSTALASRGVELARGDQDDPASLAEPFAGLASLFLMTTFSDDSGVEGETRRGKAVGDAAVQAGVPRMVYSSVGGADRDTGVPHFESKWQVEQYLRPLLPTQVVRPVFFMENLGEQIQPGDGEFVLRLAIPAGVALQLVAVRDIGQVCAAALLHADALPGDALEIAGDELTGEQMATAIGRQLGRPARYEAQSTDVLPSDDLRAMFRWFTHDPAYLADFAATRALDPDVLDFAGWLAQR